MNIQDQQDEFYQGRGPLSEIDEEFRERVTTAGLEVDDDGALPVPLGEAMAQTLQEMHERGVITPSQIVEASDRFDAITYSDTVGGDDELELAKADEQRRWAAGEVIDPGWTAEIELATKRDAEQLEDPMKALHNFLGGRSIATTVVGRSDVVRWCWVHRGLDLVEMEPDEVLTFSRLAVDAMRAGQ